MRIRITKSRNYRYLLFSLSLMAITGLHTLHAQDAPRIVGQQASTTKSADQVAKELANPNTPLASLNFKNQFRWFDGTLPNASDQFSYTLLAQPVFPFPLENGAQVFFRPAIPFLIDQPVFNPAKADFDSESGIGDIAFDLAYGRTEPNGFLWAFGMISSLPTATSGNLGNGQWTLGPEVLLGLLKEKFVIGAFPSHQWDVAGWGDNGVTLTTIQLFGTYLPGGGWSIGTSPIMTYNWDSQDWSVPLNLNVGKTVIWGGKPWKISAEVNYYIERPDSFGSEWMIGINITPVVENIMASWFK